MTTPQRPERCKHCGNARMNVTRHRWIYGERVALCGTCNRNHNRHMRNRSRVPKDRYRRAAGGAA